MHLFDIAAMMNRCSVVEIKPFCDRSCCCAHGIFGCHYCSKIIALEDYDAFVFEKFLNCIPFTHSVITMFGIEIR